MYVFVAHFCYHIYLIIIICSISTARQGEFVFCFWLNLFRFLPCLSNCIYVNLKFKYNFNAVIHSDVVQIFVLSCLSSFVAKKSCHVHLTEKKQKQNKGFELLAYWWQRRTFQLHFMSVKHILYFGLIF